MTNNEENEQIARAIALSLQGLESQFEQDQQEKQDLKEAIAASLGKKVHELTARDMLLADAPTTTNKRPREEEEESSSTHHILKRIDNSKTRFWDGTVKLTYVKGFVGPDYIRFQDIVQKVSIKSRDYIIHLIYGL
jgi:tyrosyl-DNA phosphodiesterase-1